MKKEKTEKAEFGLPDHGLHKGQRTRIGGKRVVVTRTVGATVWHRRETRKELAMHLINQLRALLARPRVKG